MRRSRLRPTVDPWRSSDRNSTTFKLIAVLGLVGVVLGQIELSKIDAGESPHGGRGMALGAIVFGAIGLVMSVALVLLGVGVLLVLEY